MAYRGQPGDFSERDLKEGLLHLLAVNGFREEDLKTPERITNIEMVLDDYCCMRTLAHFPKLQSVSLIQQDIQKIEGLEYSPELQRLLLNENSIKKIEGLQNCLNLQKLYLPFNCIKEIGSGLAGLEQLEVLWLAGNQLRSLENLVLPSLTELNAASNQLSSVVGAFDQLPQLQSLNLSGNRLCSFKEVLDLSRSSLTALSFADPDFGENPICSLCNYQTYVLYHLPKLQVHDQMYVDAEAHNMAQAAYAQKRLYYNMHIKTLKRQSGDCLRAAKVIHEARCNTLGQDLSAAARLLRRADAFRQSREKNGGDEADPAEYQDLELATRRLQLCEVELADADFAFQQLQQSVQQTLDAHISRLLLELRSGGNVRFEKVDDTSQVAGLVTSRFRPEDFSLFGFNRIKIGQVTRLHHRSLQLRFEQLMDCSDMSAAFEYLFYVPQSRNALEELQEVAQAGPQISERLKHRKFSKTCSAEELDEIGIELEEGPSGPWRKVSATDSPVLLTNSLALAEAGRLLYNSNTEMGQALGRSMSRARPNEVGQRVAGRRGVVLICKVHLGEQLADYPSCFASNFLDVHDLWQREPSKKDPRGPVMIGDDTSVLRSLQRASIKDEKVKVWNVPYVELILPEFLVEFEYVHDVEFGTSKDSQTDCGAFDSLLAEYSFFGQMGVEQETQQRKRKPADVHDLSQITQEDVDPHPSPSHGLPQLPNLPQILHLDAKKLMDPSLRVCKFTELKVLNLHGRQLRRIAPEAFDAIHGLETLLLSFNCIESLSAIPACDSLICLDLAHNLIQKVHHVVGFPMLRELDLSWNQLSEHENFLILGRELPYLETLEIRGNLLVDSRSWAVRKMHSLRILDGKEVTPDEVQAYRNVKPLEFNEDLLRKHAFAPPKGISQRLPGETGYDPEKDRISTLMAMCTANPDRAPFISRANWRSKVLAVDLQGVGLTDLRFLAELPECQFLCLSDNEIPNLDWLPPLQKLESLHLERCNLTSLKGIARCQELQKLEAGGNHLTDALELQKLSKLSQVSLEDNFVDSLDTFAQLSCLMELYLSNNVIEELRSLLLLKQLPKLLVLDLAGNDLCKASDYRQYAMFHLRKLKVLDGIPLSKAEQQQADEKFSGKVTMELLEDKLGPSPSCYTFRTVDLSNQGIREIGQLINDDLFPSLRELVLDGNPITDIRNLGPLVKLLVLRLNKTKLDLESGVLGGAEFTGGLGTFPNLQVLELGYSCIADMRVFSELPLQSLRILHLPGNEISKLEGLNKMEQLRELVLDKNRVKQFDEKSFEGLRALRELRVEDNGLKSLSNIGPLPRLRALYLSLNRIVELSELEKLRPLRHLLVVHMAQNPVARKPQYRLQLLHCVPTARAVDGREVTHEEPERLDQVAFMDGGKTAAVYVFNDPPPSNVQVTFISPPVATVQVPGGPGSDLAKAPGAERDRRSSQGQVEMDLSGLKKDRAQSARKTVPNTGPGR